VRLITAILIFDLLLLTWAFGQSGGDGRVETSVVFQFYVHDTNAWWTVRETTDLTASNGWRNSHLHGFKMDRIGWHSYWEPVPVPEKKFYRAVWEYRETHEGEIYPQSTATTTNAAGPPPLPE
jgi:hypothetical protein